jgi:tetratricopeptide (TPR) repeat protein
MFTANPKEEKITNFVWGIAITLLSCLLYVNSLKNGFTLDDIVHIQHNPLIQSSALDSFFFEPIFPGNLYRPLVQASYRLTYILFGLNPAAYHLVNILSHALVALLVFLLCLRLLDGGTAKLTALFFVFLPIHTEAVANISGRYELWAALFALASLLLACKSSTYKNLIYIFVCFLAALLSKESAFVVIPLFLLFNWYSGTWRLRPALPFALAAGIYLIMRWRALGGDIIGSAHTDLLDNPLIVVDSFTRILNAVFLLGRYFVLSIIPFRLSADYSFQALLPVQAANPLFLAAVLIVTFLFLKSLFDLKRRTYVAFGFLWFFLAFAVTSNILFPIGTIFGERLAYLPSVGVCIIISQFLLKFPKSQRCALTAAILLAYGWVAFKRNLVWADNMTLHAEQIQISPNSAKTQFNYAMALRGEKKYAEATEHISSALSLYPNYDDALWGLAILNSDQGHLGKAEYYLRKTLDIRSDHERSLNSIVRLYLRSDRPEKLEPYLQKLLAIWGKNLDTKITYLGVLIEKRDKENAQRLRAEIEKIDPENEELKVLIAQGKEHGVF